MLTLFPLNPLLLLLLFLLFLLLHSIKVYEDKRTEEKPPLARIHSGRSMQRGSKKGKSRSGLGDSALPGLGGIEAGSAPSSFALAETLGGGVVEAYCL